MTEHDEHCGCGEDRGDLSQAANLNDLTAGEELSPEELLEKVAFYAFDQAQLRLEQSGYVEPFTILIEGDNLLVENHPGEDAAECFESARRTVYVMQSKISAYVFCYDGYVELDEGTRDAIIVERASKGDEMGEALAMMYSEDDDSLVFEDEIYCLGEGPSFFNTAEEITPDQLEER
jgi:hypothetical protein